MKEKFPIFNDEYHQKKSLIFLDNASTTHKPLIVIDALNEYYTKLNSNTGRGLYRLANLSQQSQDLTRKNLASFINCQSTNIVFTSGCTDSINLAAYIVSQKLKPKQKILLSIAEHHANILPWQRMAKEKDLEIVFISDADQLLDPYSFEWDNVGLIALSHVSNVTGQIHPIELWCKKARENGVISVIDGAQGIVSQTVDIQKIDCDFYAFSSHKLYGPMGLGFLYIHSSYILNEPLILGGGIVDDVTQDGYELNSEITRFEAGTANVCAIHGFNSALNFLTDQNWENSLEKMHNLSLYLYDEISQLDFLTIQRLSNSFKHTHICSFLMHNVHSHDVGTFLAEKDIAVRVGHHCAKPLHHYWGQNSTIRASLGLYNEKSDIDALVLRLKQCYDFFK